MNESQYIEPGFVPLPQIQEIQKDIKKPKEYPKINKKLQEISEKLMNANPGIGEFHFEVFSSKLADVQHSQERNIFLSNKLIALAKNESQLAFIISHEMAHWINQDMSAKGARIPMDNFDIEESECKAHITGMTLFLRAGYKKEEALKLLQNIRNMYPTDMTCNLD